MEKIKVLIVDNEEVYREGLAKLLKEQPRVEVVWQCESSIEMIEKSGELKPDVILMSSQIAGYDALETVKEIRRCSPQAKVVLITRPELGEKILDILKAGARACLNKAILASDLVKAIELISSGRIIIGHNFAEVFLDEIVSADEADRRKADEMESGISEREIEITRLIAVGSCNKEIAAKLLIAESTVKVHVKNILKKLELRNRQQLAAYAVLKNWVDARAMTEAEITK